MAAEENELPEVPIEPPRKRGRKPREEKLTIRSIKRVFLNEFSLEDFMLKEAAQEAIRFRNSLH